MGQVLSVNTLWRFFRPIFEFEGTFLYSFLCCVLLYIMFIVFSYLQSSFSINDIFQLQTHFIHC